MERGDPPARGLGRLGRPTTGPARALLLSLSLSLLGALALQAPAAASTTTSPNGPSVPVYGQQWQPWGPEDLGTSTSTIAEDGCALTASAMLLAAYGVSINPGALNQWLIANGGYVAQNLLIWGAVAQYAQSQGVPVSYTGWKADSVPLIDSSLEAGNPVIAQVTLDGNMHFVLITGLGPGGALWINDPWFGDHTTFQARYGNPATQIQSLRLYSGPPAPGAQLSPMAPGSPATVSSAAGALGTDSQGAALLLLPYTTPTSSWAQGTAVAVSGWSPAQISFTVPAGTGPGYLVVETSAGDPNFWFPFTPVGAVPVQVGSISPAGGPVAGGTTVTIAGAGFTNPSQVDFGSQPAASVTYVSSTELTAVSPSGVGQPYLTVSDWLGSATSSSPFLYPVSAAPGALTSLPPARICDTRPGNPSGLTGAADQCLGHTLASGVPLQVQVAGVGGVPASGATAAVLNITVTDPSTPGYLTVYPAGQPAPLSSNLNFAAGQTVANLAEVGLSPGGQVALVSDAASVDVVIDVEGYVSAPATPGEGLYDQLPAPTRICDTRTASPANQCTGKTLGPGSSLAVQVTGLAGIPSGATAVVANVTATDTGAVSYFTVYPSGSPPTSSNLNWVPGETVANLVTAQLSPTGSISVYNQVGSADLVIDVLGYYTAPAGTGSEFNALTTPTRICDTRPSSPQNQCTGKTLGPGGSLTLQVTGLAGVPSSALSVVLNVTATDTSAPGYFTVYPGGAVPLASSLNWDAGSTVANLTVAALGPQGTITVYNDEGSADLVVDVLGWYG